MGERRETDAGLICRHEGSGKHSLAPRAVIARNSPMRRIPTSIGYKILSWTFQSTNSPFSSCCFELTLQRFENLSAQISKYKLQ